jgi:hypothetical protein
VQIFTDPSSATDFKARVITLTISEPLQQTFQGSQPNKFFAVLTEYQPRAQDHRFGRGELSHRACAAVDAAIGDLTVKLGFGIYAARSRHRRANRHCSTCSLRSR